MENTNELTLNSMTEEQFAMVQKLILDIVFTAFRHIDWDATEEDFENHHKPVDYGIEEENFEELFESITGGLDGAVDEIEDLREDGYYNDLLGSVLKSVFDHESEKEKSEQLN